MISNQKKLQFIFNLRSANITDTKLLKVIEQTPRENFIRNSFNKFFLDDTALPIGCGQTTTQPTIIGTMIQALQITSRCKILEIGTGSGYQTAILAKLGRRVYSIERYHELAVLARDSIDALSLVWTFHAASNSSSMSGISILGFSFSYWSRYSIFKSFGSLRGLDGCTDPS